MDEMSNQAAHENTEPNYDNVNNEEDKTTVPNVYNPFVILTPRVKYLVYWENPNQSGAVFAGTLAAIIITSYIPIINTFCFLATVALGMNWVLVIVKKQIQKLMNQEPVNIYEAYLCEKPWYIEQITVDKYVTVCVHGVNFLLLEIQKIALVDDPLRTVKYIILSYILWTITGWMSLRTIVVMSLIAGFSIPKAYLCNKTIVDERIDHLKINLLVFWRSFLDLTKQHTGGLFHKGKLFAVNKGWMAAEQKEE